MAVSPHCGDRESSPCRGESCTGGSEITLFSGWTSSPSAGRQQQPCAFDPSPKPARTFDVGLTLLCIMRWRCAPHFPPSLPHHRHRGPCATVPDHPLWTLGPIL
eukprot:6331771-Prymnesium_polylepis.1